MKRNFNEENYVKIESNYIERQWTTYFTQSAKQPASNDYWESTKYPPVVDTDTTKHNDTISVEQFLDEHYEVFRPYSLADLVKDFESQPDRIQIPPPGIDDDMRKAYVMLNEAGAGKSTYLTWLAYQLSRAHPLGWITKLKLIECSIVLKANKHVDVNNETAALRLLFELVYMNFLAPNINSKGIEYAERQLQIAQECAGVLNISGGVVELDTTKIKTMNIAGAALVLLRIFRIKYNDKQIYLLLDGFDEIAPTYKKTTLDLLPWLNGFEGVRKLYLTSRPYGFRETLKNALKRCLFCQIFKFSKHNVIHYTYLFVTNKSKNCSSIDENRIGLIGVLYVLAAQYLRDIGEIPLFLTMALELLQHLVEKDIGLNGGRISRGIIEECKNMFEPLRMMEAFVEKKLDIASIEKTSANVGAIYTAEADMTLNKKFKKARQQHSILAMYLLFDYSTLNTLLSEDMQEKADKYMEAVRNGSEKSGIIEGVVSNKPLFIHRLFAEYFAALWFFSFMTRKSVKDFLKRIVYLGHGYKEVRYFLDRMVCSNSPVHMAILDRSIAKTEAHLKTNPGCIGAKDSWGRTPLHLAFGKISEKDEVARTESNEILRLLLERTEMSKIDAKDDYFGWSALQHAYSQRTQTLCTDEIFEHLNSTDPVEIFYYALEIERVVTSSLFHHGFALNSVFKPLFTSIARKLIEEKRLNLHSALLIANNPNSAGEHYRQLHEICSDYPAVCTPHMLETLVNAAGGPEKILSGVAPRLISLGCKRKSFVALWYLIIDCKCQLPSIEHFQEVVSFLRVYLAGDREMFRRLYHQYCEEYHIPCLAETQHCETDMFEEKHRYTNDASLFTNTSHLPVKKKILHSGRDNGTQFLLWEALKTNNVTIAKYLIQKTGIAVERDLIIQRKEYRHHLKVSWNCSFHFLLENTENLHGEHENGRNLLQIACLEGWLSLSKCLIEHFKFDALRENKRENNWNAIFYCVQNSESEEIFSYLMETSAMDCFGKHDSDGKSVFYYAVKNNSQIANSIIGKECHAGLKDLNNPPITRLTTTGLKVVEMFDYLMKNDLSDETSLRTVCSALQIAEHLAVDARGCNLLHFACFKGWLSLVKCLVEHFSFSAFCENARENNWNAFFYCVQGYDNGDIFKYLKDKHAVDCFGRHDADGKSVFYYAIDKKSPITYLIIKNEFDAELKKLNIDQLARLVDHLHASGCDIVEMFDFLSRNELFDETSLKTVCTALQITQDDVFGVEGRNLLHLACIEGWLSLVKCLIEHFKFDALRENEKESNWNAFFYCVTSWSRYVRDSHDRTRTFFFLMQNFDIDLFGKHDSNGKSIFYYAVTNNRELTELIISKMLDAELEDIKLEHISRLTINMKASGFEIVDFFQFLHRNELFDETLLETVCSTLQITENLAIDEQGRNLLHIACVKGWLNLVKCLMNHFHFNASYENQRCNNWNAFFYCAHKYGSIEIFSYLMDKCGMDCFGRQDSQGKNVFYYAVKHNKDMAVLIIRKQFDAELKDLCENSEQMAQLTSLFNASGFDTVEMFEYFIKNELFDETSLVSVCRSLQITEDTVFGKEGRNLLHTACVEGWLSLVKCLVDHLNFDALRENEKENNWNAFFYCVRSCKSEGNHDKVFSFLMGNYAIDCFGKHDSNGRSIFYHAVIFNSRIAGLITSKEFDVELQYFNKTHVPLLANHLKASGTEIVDIFNIFKRIKLTDSTVLQTICSTLQITQDTVFGDNNRNLLHIACIEGMLSLVICLVEDFSFDALHENKREYNWNAYFYCLQECENNEIFSYLMEKYDMDWFGKRDLQGKSVFYYAVKNNSKHANAIVRKVFNAELSDLSLEQVRQLASHFKAVDLEVVRVFDYLKNNRLFDVSSLKIVCSTLQITENPIFDDDGVNLLHIACMEGWLSLVKCLIKYFNFDALRENEHNTRHAFYYCLLNAYDEIFLYLMEEYKMDCFDKQDLKGKTIFYYAVKHRLEIAFRLLYQEFIASGAESIPERSSCLIKCLKKAKVPRTCFLKKIEQRPRRGTDNLGSTKMEMKQLLFHGTTDDSRIADCWSSDTE